MIEEIKARKIIDSRGDWTIEVDVLTKEGFGRCAAPSGASIGKYEVKAFPDGGVEKALKEVKNTIAPMLIGMDPEEQEVIDDTLKDIDGTNDFSKIGGNTAMAISLANAKAAASAKRVPLCKYLGGCFTFLPLPLANVIGGGAHAPNSTDIQEFLIVSMEEKISEAIGINCKIHRKIKEIAKEKIMGKGDEGAWALNAGNEEALDILVKACAEIGAEVKLGLDIAATELWDPKKRKYIYKNKSMTREEQIGQVLELIEKYDLSYVEDPVHEDDFEGYAEINKANCIVCGDDLYATNVKRLEKGIKERSTNAILIKPNQCGTLTDVYKTVSLAKENKIATIFSHRSGETTDDTISHLAVGLGGCLIKTGAVGGERIAKLNELIRIEESAKIKLIKWNC